MKKAGILLVIFAVAGLAVALLASCSARDPEPYTTLPGATMGTTYTVRLAGSMSREQHDRWQQQIEQCLEDINARMSTYRADSEVSRFNRSTSTDWFPVSFDTASVVAASLQVAEQTEGAFDITVGPLVNLWNFGPDRRPAGIPTDAEINAARKYVGYRYLTVRLDPPALRKEYPELTIDLSGIAKGFAVDQVGELLERGGMEGYLVEVGGEVRTRGTKGNGQLWRIAVEQPVVGQRLIESVLELKNACLATSGDYRNFFEWDGQLYSHEIDPSTGRPAQQGMAEVAVLHAKSAMWADAYATGLMVMPPDQVWRLAEELELEIMMMVRDPAGLRQRVTPGFAAAIVDDSK